MSDTLPEPTNADIRANALSRMYRDYSNFMRKLTGNATLEERDTWKTKEEAARAYIAATATDTQTSMIENEAAGDGTDPAFLAQIIIAKAEKFQELIGLSSGLKAKTKKLIADATEDSRPINESGPAVEAILNGMNEEARAAAQYWLSTG